MPNTLAARQAKRRKRIAAGGIAELRERLWAAVEAAASIADDTGESPELRLRAVHAVSQAAASYTRVLEADEFHARLLKIEAEIRK